MLQAPLLFLPVLSASIPDRLHRICPRYVTGVNIRSSRQGIRGVAGRKQVGQSLD
jgi:hypothetical protein